jgi:DNA (cytosine-5)-methyltransferase 1
MSLGFQNAGFDIVAAFDNWLPAVNVYRQNFDHPVELLDLAEPAAMEMLAKFNPQIIIGGPPCQDFSSAGVNNYSASRANLAERYAHIIQVFRPTYFVLENVPRIRHTEIFTRIENKLQSAGYGLTRRILDASYCGVPQTRKRLFLVGCLGEDTDFLGDIIDQNLSKSQLTMREYFGDELDTDYYFRVPTNYTRRGVFSVDDPCVTIRGIDRPIPSGYKGHPNDPAPIGPLVRALTVAERARVQTFPKNFVFDSTKTNLNHMIGNAVPVKMAELVANAIAQHAAKTLAAA